MYKVAFRLKERKILYFEGRERAQSELTQVETGGFHQIIWHYCFFLYSLNFGNKRAELIDEEGTR